MSRVNPKNHNPSTLNLGTLVDWSAGKVALIGVRINSRFYFVYCRLDKVRGGGAS